jgi:hypothetical protein
MTQYWKDLCYHIAVPVPTTWRSFCHLGTGACIQYKHKCPQMGTECWYRGLNIPQQQTATFNGQRIKFDVQVSPTESCHSKHSYFKNSDQSLVSQTAFPQAVEYVHSRSTRQASKKFHITTPSQTEEKSVITRRFPTTLYITFNILQVWWF